MSEKSAVILGAIALVIFVSFLSFKAWAKNELCKTYYSEMNRVACFLNDSTLPQRSNR